MQYESNLDYLLDDQPEDIKPEETVEETTEVENETTEETEDSDEITESEDDLDAFSTFLKNRGVRDGKTIVRYKNDDSDETEEIEFNSLSKNEQLEILEALTDPGLTAEEIETINVLRKNNMTMQDVIAYYQNAAVEEYKKSMDIQPKYSIDDYTDDDLFIADLKAKYSDMTDEEIQNELELAKTNEDLFKRKVDVIRNNYKTIEDNQAREQQEAEQAQREAYQNSFKEALTNFDSISLDYRDAQSDVMSVEDSDKQLIYNYIFNTNTEGISQFVADLADPKVIVDLAWYRLFGKDAISDISRYWKEELKKSRKSEPKQKSKNVEVKPATDVVKTEDKTSLSSVWDHLI